MQPLKLWPCTIRVQGIAEPQLIYSQVNQLSSLKSTSKILASRRQVLIIRNYSNCYHKNYSAVKPMSDCFTRLRLLADSRTRWSIFSQYVDFVELAIPAQFFITRFGLHLAKLPSNAN